MRKIASLVQKHTSAAYGVLGRQNSVIKRFNSAASSSGHGEKRTFPKVSNIQDKRNLQYFYLISSIVVGVYLMERMIGTKTPKPLLKDGYQQ
ncbi:hypothetical protein C9374_010061 [Naegleria lovaniensis]|uniref:Uncharacterized protein n=1 Tax=Naegleria lovaniensis TaxID=51637 RepID=A0AA88GGA6_NAELO|nr:uncharacterized protein C9374_010061 [Naegleria lovaniensis]KAG2375057.1 hypothetical protein C9374_010061 [Naegleria lovaniensis]